MEVIETLLWHSVLCMSLKCYIFISLQDPKKFPNLWDVKREDIERTLRNKSIPYVIFWIAGPPISKELSSFKDFPDFLGTLVAHLVLTPEEWDKISSTLTERSTDKAIRELRQIMQFKPMKDIEKFVSIMSETPELLQLAEHIQPIITRCGRIEEWMNTCSDEAARSIANENHTGKNFSFSSF